LDEPESVDVANVTDRATAACGACSDVDDLKAPDEDMVLVLQCSVIAYGYGAEPEGMYCLTL
jgi:Zn ribbon nucleic-acid-binding protein